MISCNYCGKFVQSNPDMCGHYSCPECKTEFKECIFCLNIQGRLLCINCNHYRTKMERLPCEHFLCNKCNSESQGQYVCIENPCHYCNKCSSQPTMGLCQKMLCKDCDKYLNFESCIKCAALTQHACSNCGKLEYGEPFPCNHFYCIAHSKDTCESCLTPYTICKQIKVKNNKCAHKLAMTAL